MPINIIDDGSGPQAYRPGKPTSAIIICFDYPCLLANFNTMRWIKSIYLRGKYLNLLFFFYDKKQLIMILLNYFYITNSVIFIKNTNKI